MYIGVCILCSVGHGPNRTPKRHEGAKNPNWYGERSHS